MKDLICFITLSQFKSRWITGKNHFYYSSFFTVEPPYLESSYLIERFSRDFDSSFIGFELVLDHTNPMIIDNERYFHYRGSKPFTTSLSLYRVKVTTFFTLSYLKSLLEFLKENSNITIFLFADGIGLDSIKAAFRENGVIISGGNNTLKHILSPHQFAMSRIISLLYPYNKNVVNTSFINISSHSKNLTRPLYNFTSASDRLMIEKIREFNNQFLNLSEEERFKQMYNFDNYNERDFSYKYSRDYNVKKNRDNGVFRDYYNQKRKYHSSSLLNIQINNQINKNISKNYTNTNYFPYLSNLAVVLDDSTKTDLEKQTKLENFLSEFIQKQFEDDKLFVNKYKGYLNNLKKSEVKESIYEALKTYLLHNRKGELNDLLPKTEKESLELIIITYSIIIAYFNKLGYTSIAGIIGKVIMEKMYLKERKNIINTSIIKKKTLVNFEDYLKFKKVTSTTILRIGDYFISLLSQFPHNIFERNYALSTKTNKEVAKIQINIDYINSVVNNIILQPANLPMICEPLKWSHKNYGGYVRNLDLKERIVSKSSDNKHITKVNKILYETVNILNSIKFSVNNLLLNYLSNEGKYILHEVKPKDVLQRIITLKLAESLSKSHFYLTVRSDWRGRLVTESFFLTYQGNDLSVSLINFWEGEPLTEQGLYYFKIFGANTHNIDSLSKKSYFDRVEWVNDNYDKIISLNRDLILSAENPFSFTSFCLNMRELDKNPTWIVKSPVFLDATCSGIQHLAALLQDVELGANVNLLKSSHLDTPNDLYSRLLDPINKAINKYGAENVQHSNLSLIKLDRKSIKQSIMTKVYNVSTYGIKEQLKSKFEKIDEESLNEIVNDFKSKFKITSKNLYLAPGKDSKVTLSNHDIYIISKIINDEIFIIYPSLNDIYSYFINMVQLVITLGVPLSWVTPDGMEIVQHYLQTKNINFEINILGRKKFVLKNVIDKMYKSKQINAFIPNIIHSLDACHLMKVVISSIKGGYYPILTIHDCFGTHPNKMEILSHRVKSEFVLLYSKDNFLNKFHKHIIASLKANNFKVVKNEEDSLIYVKKEDKYVKIPKIPMLGKLDLNIIKESSYMIS